MKKLMIAAVTAMLGIAVNAATASWEAGDVLVRGGTMDDFTSDYLVYFVDAATYSYENAAADIAKGDIAFLSKEGVYAQQGAYQDLGYIKDVTADRFGNDTAITAYAVVIDGTSLADAKYAFLGETDTKKTGSEGQPAVMFLDVTGTMDSTQWTKVAAVPEPTSGLLLLLGVAGLALRRRRA